MSSSAPAAGVDTDASSSRPRATSILDATAFPHIVESIISYLDYPTAIEFRLTSSFYRDQIDATLFNHIVVGLDTSGVQLQLRLPGERPDERRLPCLPSDALVAGGVVESTASKVKRSSRQRQLMDVRTIDIFLPVLSSPLVHDGSLYEETQNLRTVRRYFPYNPIPLPITCHPHTVIDWYNSSVSPPIGSVTTLIPSHKRHVLHFKFSNYTMFNLSIVEGLLWYPREVESSVLVFDLQSGLAAADMADDASWFFVPDLSTPLKLIPGLASVARRGGTVTVVGLETVHPVIMGLPLSLGGKNGENTVTEFRRLLLDAIRQPEPAEQASADTLAAPGENEPDTNGDVTSTWGEAEQNEAIARVSFQTISQWRASADPLESEDPGADGQVNSLFGGDGIWYDDGLSDGKFGVDIDFDDEYGSEYEFGYDEPEDDGGFDYDPYDDDEINYDPYEYLE